jgi:hypothetical protein
MPGITACTAVQCSVMDDSAFLSEHAIFGPPPHRNPLTDQYEILHNLLITSTRQRDEQKSDNNRFSGSAPNIYVKYAVARDVYQFLLLCFRTPTA